MDVPVNVKDIPLPGEDLQNTINTEINNLTRLESTDIVPNSDETVGSVTDIPKLLEDVQKLVDNTYEAMTNQQNDSVVLETREKATVSMTMNVDEKTEEQLIEEQAAEAIAECTDLLESKEQIESDIPDEVAAQCEIITETPDDSIVLTLNASDLEESDKNNTSGEIQESDKTQEVVIEEETIIVEPNKIQTETEPETPMEVESIEIVTTQTTTANTTETIIKTTPETVPETTTAISQKITETIYDKSITEEIVSVPVVTENNANTVYVIEEITEPIIVEQKDLIMNEKATVVEVINASTVTDITPLSETIVISEDSIKSKDAITITEDTKQKKTETVLVYESDKKAITQATMGEKMEVDVKDTKKKLVQKTSKEGKTVNEKKNIETKVTTGNVKSNSVDLKPVKKIDAKIETKKNLKPSIDKVTLTETSSTIIVTTPASAPDSPAGEKTITITTSLPIKTNVSTPTATTSHTGPKSVTRLQSDKKSASEKAKSIRNDFPNVPCHVLGRNIDNPQEDLVSNGRTPPKPRLGVKVPYRNLTSQIVSRQDIANELIERAAKRNPDPDPPLGGDIFFAKKLTQRLATKIAMKTMETSLTKSDTNLLNSPILESSRNTTPSKTLATQSINNKSDLLAILEGEVEVDLAKELGNKKTDEVPPVLTPETEKRVAKMNVSSVPPKLDATTSDTPKKKIMDPEIERIIALKQLQQFPKRSLRGRYRKQNLHDQVKGREDMNKEIELPTEQAKTIVKLKEDKTDKKLKEEIKTVVKEDIKEKKKVVKPEEKPDKQSIVDNLMPLSTKKITKTYSRKEPIVVVPPDLARIVDEGESSQNEAVNGDMKKDGEKMKIDKKTDKKLEKVEKKNDKEDKKPDKKIEKNKKLEQDDKKTATEEKQLEKNDKKPKKLKKIVTVEEINKPEVTLMSKRARVIKKKVIWDPDEAPKRKSISPKKPTGEEKPKTIKKQVEKEETEEENEDKPLQEKKIEQKKIAKVITKAKKILNLRKGKKILLKKRGKLIRATNGEVKTISVKIKKPILKKRIRPKLTELDRLLMDEGAVNMLFNAKQDRKSIKKGVISLDRAQRELENRTKAVREIITSTSTQDDSPKSLRRNNPPPLAMPTALPPRKKSRDSLRSSIQSPPPSPSFLYPRAEASRIIRRHSSSFSSECSTPRRMSIDQSGDKTEKPEVKKEDEKVTDIVTVTATVKRKKGVPIYVRKADERTYVGKQKADEPKEKLSKEEKRKLSNETSKKNDEQPRKRTRSSIGNIGETSSPTKKTKKVDRFSELVKPNDENQNENEKRVSSRNTFKEISVRRIENLVQVIMTPTTTKIKNAVNVQMLNELGEILNKLAKDETCRVVLVSSTDNYFCHGIDFSILMQANADKRLSVAQDMAKAVKDFLLALAFFPKPLVAGVQGPAVGLGVTILPLFDLVLASDKATFATPYVRLGHIPEGAILFASPHINGSVLTSELVFACRKLTASEALQHGLVTRVLWPDKFQEELIPIAKAVSKQSQQCMMATKRVLRKSILSDLQSSLEDECRTLIDQWTSPECQQNFKKLLQENEWW